MNTYEVACEISGPTAMWTRPDIGDASVSDPITMFAAVKRLFESSVWLKSAEVVPVLAQNQATPPGLPRWFSGFCTSRLLISSEQQVAQKPLNPRRKVGGGTEPRLLEGYREVVGKLGPWHVHAGDMKLHCHICGKEDDDDTL